MDKKEERRDLSTNYTNFTKKKEERRKKKEEKMKPPNNTEKHR